MNKKLICATALWVAIPLYAKAYVVLDLNTTLHNQCASPFSTASGKPLWNKTLVDTKTGKQRSCTTSHATEPTQQGVYERTVKATDAFASQPIRSALLI